MASIRKVLRRSIILLSIFCCVLFLLACTNAFISADRWWFISLLGLIFPLLLLLVFLFLLFFLFVARKWALLPLITLMIGWVNIRAFFAMHPRSHFEKQKKENAIRILTWNVRRWDEFITRKPGASGHRNKMMAFLHDQQADVMCFQEFFDSHNPDIVAPNIPYIVKQLSYPYYYFSHDYQHNHGMYEGGTIIFSRYPIINTLQVRYNSPPFMQASESLIGADINVNGHMIRIFTTHLQSVLFRSTDFRNIEIIRNVDDSVVQASKSIVKKLKRGYQFRAGQADLVREQLDKSPFPSVICGDFNDVPNSYTYFHIRGNRQDAFISKGFGIGRSYVHISPTLRIDYIFADKQLPVLQCRKFDLPYSDHHPFIADLSLPN